jgi:hypothetical protein
MVFGIKIPKAAVESAEQQIIGELEQYEAGRKGRNWYARSA